MSGQGHPADAARDLADLRRRLAGCRLCVRRGIRVESLPVLSCPPNPDALLVGQAPGIREAGSRLPFSGPAGERLRRWLTPAGLGSDAEFRRRLAIVSVARCFPGRRSSGGDLPPSAAMRGACLPWLRRELSLVDAPVIVTVGAMALEQLIPGTNLDRAVGSELRHPGDGRPVIALPHPSGASAWPHRPGNAARLDAAITLVVGRLGVA